MKDKPFFRFARCARCGKAKNQHRAISLECPVGKRTPTGYKKFSAWSFVAKKKGRSHG